MYLQFSLLLSGSLLLFGQTTSPDKTPGDLAVHTAVQNEVDAGLTPRARVDEVQAARSAIRDAELLTRSVSLDDLTEQGAAQLEQAAQRQLDRAKAHVEQVRTMVDAGLLPRQNLETPIEEQALAQSTYELTLSRTELLHERSEMARIEAQVATPPAESAAAPLVLVSPVMEKFEGDGAFTAKDFHRVQAAFELQFHKPLPVSAEGETAVHRALGFDHRDRVDVALFPDTTEGKWLRQYLEASDIPYYAFRSEVPGKATAAHIHIGPPSTRLPAHSGV